MTEHGVDPHDYMIQTHAIDLSPVPPCPLTQKGLSLLPGRKVIYTNAPRHWAEKMTKHLGIFDQFDGVFAIEDADYLPKPASDAFDIFLKQQRVDPKTACMFEDMEENLKTAHDTGMTTVWLHRQNENTAHPHVHHSHRVLTDWFKDTTGKK